MIPFPEGISPDIFTISLGSFTFTLYWYALAYVVGILAWWQIASITLKKSTLWPRNAPPMSAAKLEDLVTYLVLGIILGGRLGYVVFYNPQYYLDNFSEIFMIWKGGMSFHGGLIGVIIGTYIFSKKNHFNPYIFLDLISLVAPIGIFFGRVANFLNSELYGKETTVSWGVTFTKVDNVSRHPSQLYEAGFEGIILFLILTILVKNNFLERKGFISALFL